MIQPPRPTPGSAGPLSSFRIEPSVQQGVIVLELFYETSTMFARDSGPMLGRALVSFYQNSRNSVPNPNCVVVIHSDVAGSPVVRALFTLWDVVVQLSQGRLVCVGFPEAFLPALDGFGLQSLDGFSLLPTLPAALEATRQVP